MQATTDLTRFNEALEAGTGNWNVAITTSSSGQQFLRLFEKTGPDWAEPLYLGLLPLNTSLASIIAFSRIARLHLTRGVEGELPFGAVTHH